MNVFSCTGVCFLQGISHNHQVPCLNSMTRQRSDISTIGDVVVYVWGGKASNLAGNCDVPIRGFTEDTNDNWAT